MALGKNIKKDRLIPSKPVKDEIPAEEKKKPVAKTVKKATAKPTVKKVAAKSAKKKVAAKSAKKKVVAKSAAKKKEEIVTPLVEEKNVIAPVTEAVPEPPVEEVKEEQIEEKAELVSIEETVVPEEIAEEVAAPLLSRTKRVLPANFLTKEELEERKRLKAKYDHEILQLRGRSIQLIVFRLGGERYALEIDKVKEIVPAPVISRLPKAPSFMKGVANIRGSVMVIMDLEEKFELFKPEEIHEKSFTLVIKNDRFKAGILVSEVPTTLKVQGDIIESSSGIMRNTVLDETFIKGLIKQEEGMIILLDIIELIESDEIRVIAESVEDSN